MECMRTRDIELDILYECMLQTNYDARSFHHDRGNVYWDFIEEF